MAIILARLLAWFLLGFGVPILVALLGIASWKWIGLGAASWAVAVAVKAILGIGVHFAALAFKSKRFYAATWGVWSAACELGAAAAALLAFSPRPILDEAVGLGVGAGCVEVIVLFAVGVMSRGRGATFDKVEDPFVAWSGVMERASTVVGHVACRGMTWMGLASSVGIPFLALGVVTFSVVDGVAVYGKEAGWDWTDPRACRKWQGFLAGIACLEAAAFAIGWMLVGSGR